MHSNRIKPVPLPYIEERDIATLAFDLGVGYFTASDLYSWYANSVRYDGREPVTKKAFGTALRNAGLQSSIRPLGDEGKPARCWLITRPWYKRGKALEDDELTDPA